MEPAAFSRLFPKLYHLTFASNVESIRTHGLLSSAALADAYKFTDEDRANTLGQRRLCIQTLHGVSLRDQHTAPESKMKSCLVKIAPAEWLTLLNSKIFFFLSRDKAQRLLDTYASYDNALLEVDTAALLHAHAPHASLCRINSGSFIYRPVPRGRDSFIPLAGYTYRAKRDTPAELTLDVPVPAILDYARVIIAGSSRQDL